VIDAQTLPLGVAAVVNAAHLSMLVVSFVTGARELVQSSRAHQWIAVSTLPWRSEMAFGIILIATAFLWARIPTIVSGRFQYQFPDTRRDRSTGRAVPLRAVQIQPGAMVTAAC
jgi:hypothetical protein